VGSGVVAKALVELAFSFPGTPKITFIAEDGGFNDKAILADISFIPTKVRKDGVYSAISYIVPTEFSEPVRKALEGNIEDLNDKHVMNVLLGLPIKEFNGGKPQFTHRFEKIVASKLPSLPELQKGFKAYLATEISDFLPSPHN
jgi:hypothetical protein